MVRREELGHGAVGRCLRRLLVEQGSRLPDHEARGRQVGRHLGQAELRILPSERFHQYRYAGLVAKRSSVSDHFF